jgi:hypothetical protein
VGAHDIEIDHVSVGVEVADARGRGEVVDAKAIADGLYVEDRPLVLLVEDRFLLDVVLRD